MVCLFLLHFSQIVLLHGREMQWLPRPERTKRNGGRTDSRRFRLPAKLHVRRITRDLPRRVTRPSHILQGDDTWRDPSHDPRFVAAHARVAHSGGHARRGCRLCRVLCRRFVLLHQPPALLERRCKCVGLSGYRVVNSVGTG